jgi:prepilin-type N-terminal cleavage/methylation domain-containing protein
VAAFRLPLDGVPGFRPARNERGMTLLELMIVLAILSLTSSAIFSLLFAGLKTYWKGDAATQVQQGARVSIDRMMRDLRQAGQLINSVTKTVGATSVTFNTTCAAANPQVSFALPHLGTVTLTPSGSIYAPDAETNSMPHPGTMPFAGTYVSYYLAASSNSATPNATGPYLIRASYDLVANTIALSDVATNITGLSLNPGGSCPTTSSTEFTVQLTASLTQTGQNVASTAVVADGVTIRNPSLTY